MSDQQNQSQPATPASERANWEAPKLSRIDAVDAEIGAGAGGDGLAQIQS